jgi:hypothetical protein
VPIAFKGKVKVEGDPPTFVFGRPMHAPGADFSLTESHVAEMHGYVKDEVLPRFAKFFPMGWSIWPPMEEGDGCRASKVESSLGASSVLSGQSNGPRSLRRSRRQPRKPYQLRVGKVSPVAAYTGHYGQQRQHGSGSPQSSSAAQPRQGRKGACQEGREEAQGRARKESNCRQKRSEGDTGLLMSSKPHAEMQEGPDAFERFRKPVKAVIAVPKSALPARPSRTKKKAGKRKA